MKRIHELAIKEIQDITETEVTKITTALPIILAHLLKTKGPVTLCRDLKLIRKEKEYKTTKGIFSPNSEDLGEVDVIRLSPSDNTDRGSNSILYAAAGYNIMIPHMVEYLSIFSREILAGNKIHLGEIGTIHSPLESMHKKERKVYKRKHIVTLLGKKGVNQSTAKRMVGKIPDIFTTALESGKFYVCGAFSMTKVKKGGNPAVLTGAFSSAGIEQKNYPRTGVSVKFSKVIPKCVRYDANLIACAVKRDVKEEHFKAYLEVLTDILRHKGEITIYRLGSFIKTSRKATRSMDVGIGKVVDRPATTYMRFKESKYLRRELNAE
jgi:nucleoid DNA-binding protein